MAKIDKKEKAESADHPPLPKIRLESANETIGKVVLEIRNCQMNIPKIRELYKTIPPVTKKQNNRYRCEKTRGNIASILKVQIGE